MNVSLSSDSEFITKLSKIVEANLADEDFGVKELARKIRISRTQLHRKLKSINNQSVSQFIREIRLNRAKEMLGQDMGTVSEIAYKVGFGSPSYFIKCFHEYFGYPPGVVLKLPHENSEEKSGHEALEQSDDPAQAEITKTGKGSLVKLLIGLLLILTIVTVTIFIYRNYIVESAKNYSRIQDKTIAVLPLKNVTNNDEIQHLADGIMEDILNRLSHVQELKVKSRISSEHYKNPDMTLPEIAKEMNVSYILEGSILNDGDKVRIYVQLINAKNDNHFWSDEYNQDLTDIFEFTTDVSKQIAEQLQVALTAGELTKIEKNYTDNTEAYNDYLLGRYFWHKKNVNDLDKCLKYFNQAIALDSNYALAYAGLADTYNTLSTVNNAPYSQYVQKCREYAEKAISLDYNLAEGHASLGDCLSDYFLDWENAEKEFKLAIKLNPNFALTYKYYAEFLMKTSRNKEARIHMNKGIELYPQSVAMYVMSWRCYYAQGNFDAALKEIERESELTNWDYPLQKFHIYFHLGKDDEAFMELLKYFSSAEPQVREQLKYIYSESGLTGILKWLIEYLKKQPPEDDSEFYNIARLYAHLGDRDNTLEQLYIIYNSTPNIILTYIKNNPDFNFLHGDPRFIELLYKMNLSDK